jgi:2'-5' RNA ligase
MHTRTLDGQGSLPGFEGAAPIDNLFFAIFPDIDTSVRINDLAREIGIRHDLRGKPLRKDRFHVTLHELGAYDGVPPALVRDASRGAGELDVAPFGVTFDRVASFAGGQTKPCVLLGPEDDSPLHRFRHALGKRLSLHGAGKHLKSSFTPHVTLRYEVASVPMQAVPAIWWTVREFVLVHSVTGRTEHRILGRWPLRG